MAAMTRVIMKRYDDSHDGDYADSQEDDEGHSESHKTATMKFNLTAKIASAFSFEIPSPSVGGGESAKAI